MGTTATTRSRRAVLTAALATATTASSAAPQPSPDAELLEACARYSALQLQYLGLFDGPGAIADDDERDALADPIFEAQAPALATILGTPARTIAGVRAKARVVTLEDPEALKPKSYNSAKLVRSLLSDVLAFPGPAG
jgi:hypothetical protein